VILKSLKDHLRHREGTYAAMEMSDYSKKMLDNYLNMVLDPAMERTDPSTYHTTIMYSRTPVPKAEEYIGTYEGSNGTPKEWEVFPTKNNGKCLVLKLDFPIAVHLNNIFKSMGATSDYPDYKPHVTVAYDFQEDIDPTELSLPTFMLHFDSLSVKPLEPDYTPPKKGQ